MDECGCGMHHRGKMKMFCGLIVFLVGLMLYYDLKLPVILMVVGAIMFLKGMIVKMKNDQ